MKKIGGILSLTFLFVFVFLGCGTSPEKDKGSGKTQFVSGDVVAAEIPSGWSLISGTDMNGASGADYICHSDKFKIGDPYLQTTQDRDIDAVRKILESEETFGKYLGTVTLNNGTWYVAEKAAAAKIGEKACLVRGYECDFSSVQVQEILGSIRWAN